MSVLPLTLRISGTSPGVVGVVDPARHPDLAGERRVAGLDREAELVVGVLRVGIGEEVARAVLDSLVDRQQHQGSVAGAELEEQPVEPGLVCRGPGSARSDFCSVRVSTAAR